MSLSNLERHVSMARLTDVEQQGQPEIHRQRKMTFSGGRLVKTTTSKLLLSHGLWGPSFDW